MKIWNWIRRRLGFPACDLEIKVPVNLIGDVDYYSWTIIVRRDIAFWLDDVVGSKNWRLVMVEDDEVLYQSPLDQDTMVLMFRHQRDIVHFKLSWF